MAKESSRFFEVAVPRRPPIRRRRCGPALGQRGLNIMQFCKDFNAQNAKMEKDANSVTITIYQDNPSPSNCGRRRFPIF